MSPLSYGRGGIVVSMRRTIFALAACLLSVSGRAADALLGLPGGLIRQGPYLFCGDEEGMFHLLHNDRPLIHDIGVYSGLNGYTVPRDLEKVEYSREEGKVRYRGKVRGQEIEFEQEASIAGNRIRVRIARAGDWPEGTWGGVQINLPLSEYGGAAYRADGERRRFPAGYSAESRFPSGTRRLECHLGEPRLNVVFECADGLGIDDHRRFNSPNYVVSVSIPKDDRKEVEFFITLPDVKYVPRGAVRWSQIGYPAAGEKFAVLEWPKGDPRPDDRARLERRGGGVVKGGKFGSIETADHFQDNFATFDFSEVREPGEYRVVWADGKTGWFPVGKSVFPDRLWLPTLDRFIPFQMCHAEVEFDGKAAGHPECHRDDGARVDAHFPGLDGFVSYECEGTPYAAGEHIPLANGGWHDAGDHDLNVGAQSFTVWMMSLAWEEFGIDRDVSTVDAEARKFRGGRKDGTADLIQQIEWGVLWLLSVQQPDGRVYNGVCANQPQRAGKPLGELTDGKLGTGDERRVYVDYHADGQLNFAIGLAAASRALKRDRPELAQRCRAAAENALDYFRGHREMYRPGSYAASGVKGGERDASVIAAAIELYLTTNEEKHLDIVKELAPSLRELELDWPLPRATGTGGFRYVPPFLARLHPRLPDGDLKETVVATCRRAAKLKAERMAVRPWPMNIWHSGQWGNSSTCLARVFDTYWLAKVAPDILAPEAPLRNMLWIFGLHPTCDTVLVCGLGYEEPRHLYSTHLHALHGHAPASVPGAVIPGMGGFWYSGVVAYIDEHGYYGHNEACIYTQPLYIFAVNAMRRMGF